MFLFNQHERTVFWVKSCLGTCVFFQSVSSTQMFWAFNRVRKLFVNNKSQTWERSREIQHVLLTLHVCFNRETQLWSWVPLQKDKINGYLVVKMVDRNEVIPLPKSNISTSKIGHPKRTLVFRPSPYGKSWVFELHLKIFRSHIYYICQLASSFNNS